jgi:hypothetical protein
MRIPYGPRGEAGEVGTECSHLLIKLKTTCEKLFNIIFTVNWLRLTTFGLKIQKLIHKLSTIR